MLGELRHHVPLRIGLPATMHRSAQIRMFPIAVRRRLDHSDRARIRQGAISQGGDARQPLTHCDSYRLPGMLLLACWSRELRVIGGFVA